MWFRYPLVLCITLILALTACATPDVVIHPSAKEKLDGSQEIGVISLLGDKLAGTYLATLVFGNKFVSRSVQAWEMDNFVRHLIKQGLEEGKKYTYIDISYNTDDLSTAYGVSPDFFSNDSSFFQIKSVKDHFKRIHEDYSLNLLILVVRDKSVLQIPDCFTACGPWPVEGYGIFQDAGFGMRATAAHAMVQIRVIDAATAEVLASTANLGVSGAKRIPDSYRKDDMSDLSDEELKFLEKTIKELVRTQITWALRKVNIFPPLSR